MRPALELPTRAATPAGGCATPRAASSAGPRAGTRAARAAAPLRAASLAFLLSLALQGACDGGGSPPAMDEGRPPDAGCTPDCADRQCGDDGCGGTCGSCPLDQTCNPRTFQCVGGCVPDCTGRQCGSDGCAGSCGTCTGTDDCADGRCVPKASCTDGQRNGAETDADCGGGLCPKCLVGRACRAPTDCLSGLCTDGACTPDLTCQDHQIGGQETDVDCGGPKCDPCALTKFCKRHEDCLSLACIFGVCKEPTCSDGARNQGEPDVDCGGPCPKCPNGKACNAPSDCVTTACEGGFCCVPNACGACAPLPEETCDGVDNDCNDQTDEAPAIGTGAACPKQQGVCAGATARCAGAAGWQCDDEAYRARNGAYQASETNCDGRDNDCDGSADEGLLNACGTCGPVPVEACNGADDDCDGGTDEDPRCDGCVASPVPVNLDSVSTSWGLTLSWSQYAAMLGDEMFVLSYNRGGSSGTVLYRCADGIYGDAFFPGVGAYDVSAIASGGGFLHVGAEDRPRDCDGLDCMVYTRLDRDGKVLERSSIGLSVFSGDGHAAVAWGGGRAAVMFNSDEVGPQLFLRLPEGTWTWGGAPANWEYGTHFGLRSDGIAFAASRSDGYNPSTLMVNRLDPEGGTDQGWTLDDAAGRPILRVAPDDTVHVVYARSGTIRHRSLKKGSSTWTGPDDVVRGSDAGLAFDLQGRPVVAYVQDGSTVGVAVRNGASFVAGPAVSAAIADEQLSSPQAGVDSAGRVHLSFLGLAPGTWDDLQYLHYAMACPAAAPCTPDCAGRACGDDGCGGSCGPCGDGQSCQSGRCVGGPGCGLDPSLTCSGRCGKFTSGAACQCNSSCVSYGDCCPDLEACCGA